MDARVNDFLNEINEIAPLNETKEECVWEKCFDDDSGYFYYWNTKTNDVTWDMPPDYKPKPKSKKPVSLYIPPRTAPLFPSATSLLPPVGDAIKIYKLGGCADKAAGTSQKAKAPEAEAKEKEEKNSKTGKPVRRRSSSEDEKIVLISSYGGESESDEDSEKNAKTSEPVNGLDKPPKSPAPPSEDEDDVDILTKIQKKAKELRELGGELPPGVKKIVSKPPAAAPALPKKSPNNDTEASRLSLVAGYSDSEEEPEPEEVKPNFPIAPPPPKQQVAHSALFPITQPIDVKVFENPPKAPPEQQGEGEGFNSKAFQRKRRIGVALVNTGKKVKVDTDDGELRKGIGFSGDKSSGGGSEGGSLYPGFGSGGVMFVKADVLNPVGVDNVVEEKSQEKVKEVEETYRTLKEKLGFLSEGREAVSPVQVMLIQIETLYSASKDGDLKQSYLRKWLEDTCSDLIKLEKETTPEGWLLQWDRYGHALFTVTDSTFSPENVPFRNCPAFPVPSASKIYFFVVDLGGPQPLKGSKSGDIVGHYSE